MCILLIRTYECRNRDGTAVSSTTHFAPRRFLIPCSAPPTIPLLEQDATPNRIQPCIDVLDVYEQFFSNPCPDCRGEPKDMDPLPHMDPNVDGYLDEELKVGRPDMEMFVPFSSVEAFRANPPVAVVHMAESLCQTMYHFMHGNFKINSTQTLQADINQCLILYEESKHIRLCVRDCTHGVFNPLLPCLCEEMTNSQDYNVATAMRYDLIHQATVARAVHYRNIQNYNRQFGDRWKIARENQGFEATEALHASMELRVARLKDWQIMGRRDPEPLWKVEPFREEEVQRRMRIVKDVLAEYLQILRKDNLDIAAIYQAPFSLAYAVLRKMGEILAHDTGLTDYRLQATMGYLVSHPRFMQIRKCEYPEAVQRRIAAWPSWVVDEHESSIARLAGLINNFADSWVRDRHVGELVWDLDYVYNDRYAAAGSRYWAQRESYPARRKRINRFRLEYVDLYHSTRLKLQAIDEHINEGLVIDDVSVEHCRICHSNFVDNDAPFDTLAEPRACSSLEHWAAPRCIRREATRDLKPLENMESWTPRCAICRRLLVPRARIAQALEESQRLKGLVQQEFQEAEEMLALRPGPGLNIVGWDQYGHPLEWSPTPEPEVEPVQDNAEDEAALLYG